MLRAITGHEAEMAALEEGEITPTQSYFLRVRRDNSPAELAHPVLNLGWQKDGSVVFRANMVAHDDKRQFWQHQLLSTIYRFRAEPSVRGWLDQCPPSFDHDFIGYGIGPGKIYYLGIA